MPWRLFLVPFVFQSASDYKPDLKLARCPHSLAATLAALPSMSLTRSLRSRSGWKLRL